MGLTREGSGSGAPPPSKPEPDVDTAEAMGCFASPKRLGHHGSISDVCVVSYEPIHVSSCSLSTWTIVQFLLSILSRWWFDVFALEYGEALPRGYR